MQVILQSTITCPNCGHQKTETMPQDSCQFMYQCENCHHLFRPKASDCCVYCSYGDVQCPPEQLERIDSGTTNEEKGS
jgi:hypothetical protein